MQPEPFAINPRWRLYHNNDTFWLARDQVADGKWTGRCESLQEDGTWREQGTGGSCDIIPCVNMNKCEAKGLD